MKEGLKIKGELKIHRISDGKLLVHKKNLVVDTGLNLIVSRLKDASLNPVSHLAIGEGATAAAAADTALETPVGARKTVSTVTVSGAAIEIVALFDGATYASSSLREAGIFNALTGGQMISRIVFSSTPLPSTDSLQLTWTLTLANA